MSGGERPMGAAKGTQSDTEALCHPPAPPDPRTPRTGPVGGGASVTGPIARGMGP